MKAPTCRVCGEAHWAREAHVWPAGGVTHVAPGKPVNTKPALVNTRTALVNTKLVDRHAGGYMRMYMATRRAIARGVASAWPRG